MDEIGGYYDSCGRWIPLKFCLDACVECNCMPPGGEWYSACHDERLVPQKLEGVTTDADA